MKKMNHSIAVVFIVAFCFLQVQAQTLFFPSSLSSNWGKFKFSSGYQNEYIQYYFPEGSFNSSSKPGISVGAGIGMHFGERFSVFLKPTFSLMNPRFTTAQTVQEEINTANGVEIKVGYRTWSQRLTAVQVPLMARVRVFGGRFGANVAVGLSFNTFVGGKHESYFETEDGKTINGSETYFLTDGTVIDADEYPRSGDKLKFGKGAFDQYTNFQMSTILAPGFYYNLNSDGNIRLTLDWAWDLGITDLYSKQRKDFLETKFVNINGTRTMRAGLLTLGVEICPDCIF